MTIKFCGAARNVTGSAHLITLDNGYRILLDCGLFQGGRGNWERNNNWHFDPKSVDCLILSHAHIDHTGRVPQLVKDGFRGCIHSTHATRSLCGIMLLDSAKIQERDVSWYNRRLIKKLAKKKKNKGKKLTPRVTLYDSENVAETMKMFKSYPYEQWHNVHDGIELFYRDQGHILGSGSVTLRITEGNRKRTIGFTGDIGRPNRPILRDPRAQPDVDYLICESTYGDKEHDNKPQQTEKFLQIIKETCIEKKGKLIIPAFSIGRTQELVYLMDQLTTEKKLPSVPVYVDSPLAVNATDIYGVHSECFDHALNEYLLIDDNPFGFNKLKYVRSVEQSKRLNESKEPCVIISASGMMTAGRIRHHMYHNLEDEKNTFLIVGYCSPGTAGSILKNGATELKLFGDILQVKASIQTMSSFSAHGDRNEMYDNIKNQKNNLKKLFLVHGEHDTQQEFQEFLGNKGFNKIAIPFEGEEVVLR
ncbi:MAG: MBL fold metallo-hydrolase [Saprospiraceae bacterium]